MRALGRSQCRLGHKDLSLLCSVSGRTLEDFDREVYFLVRQIPQAWSEVMSWPSSVRRAMVKFRLEEFKERQKIQEEMSQ